MTGQLFFVSVVFNIKLEKFHVTRPHNLVHSIVVEILDITLKFRDVVYKFQNIVFWKSMNAFIRSIKKMCSLDL